MMVMPRRLPPPKNPKPMPAHREGLRQWILTEARGLVSRLETPLGESRLPADTEALPLDRRLAEGCIVAHRDAVAAFIELAPSWIDRFDETLGMDEDEAQRMAEVNAKKAAQGNLRGPNRKNRELAAAAIADDDPDAGWMGDDEA
jgi:hypothetical protein